MVQRGTVTLAVTGVGAMVASMLAFVGVVAPTPAAAGAPCTPRLVWAGHDGFSEAIFVADSDGTDRLRISNVDLAGKEPLTNAHPQWSPDGDRIAWDGFDGTESQIYVSDTNGLNRLKISDIGGGPGDSRDPQWSPDSARLIWDGVDVAPSPETRQIFVASATGTGRVKISDAAGGSDPSNNTRPQFSNDGTRVLWDGLGTADLQIFVADDSGVPRTEISSVGGGPPNNVEAQWSRDDTRVVWRSGADADNSQIYVADDDGTGRTNITGLGPTKNRRPQWSPVADRIVWSGEEGGLRSIFVADADGSNRVRISDVGGGTDPIDNIDPQWSPSGSHIAWSGTSGGLRSIYVARADGSDRAPISGVGLGRKPTANVQPQWSPCTVTPPPPPPGPAPHPPGSCPTATAPFTDVGGSFARADIDCMWAIGVVAGATSTTYAPGGLVTREQMAAFLARLWRALGGGCPATPGPFTDVGGSFARADIDCMFAVGVVAGATSTAYDPGGLVTREQMAAFLARLWRAAGSLCPAGPAPFTDVGGSFARADIDCMWAVGVVNGFTETTYSPGGLVTREQMAAFLARLWRQIT